MDTEYECLPPRLQEAPPRERFHVWEIEPNKPWLEFYRDGDNYLLRFPGIADFSVSHDGLHVRAQPTPDANEATLEHLYLNQVLPLSLSRQGLLVFHGSAAALPTGAVVFLARSGAGKSTLSASFARAGFPFLTDDGLRIMRSPEFGYSVAASHASIRLWDDSLDAVVGGGYKRAPDVSYTRKARVLSSADLPHRLEPCPLRRAYFLGDGSAPSIEISAVPSIDALVKLASHSFLLDIESREMIAAHFDWLSHIVQSVAFFELDYPRIYELLPEVRAAIIRHADETTEITAL